MTGIFVERKIQGRRPEESSGDEVEGINSWVSNQESSQKPADCRVLWGSRQARTFDWKTTMEDEVGRGLQRGN